MIDGALPGMIDESLPPQVDRRTSDGGQAA
jgi:hypothetical protein